MRTTLADDLSERGIPKPMAAPCAECGTLISPDCLARVDDKYCCGHCLSAAEYVALSLSDTWESDCGYEARQRRNRLLEEWRWTVTPDSPLNASSRDAFMNYLRALHRLTIDFDRPSAVVWPDPPQPTYA